MPAESAERRAVATAARAHQLGLPAEQQQEPLPCPRCDSVNTKFCYYNNYNFSQPRHFCKSCRRYWTHGGTLRDIPVGGGSRKSAKRSRTTVAANSAAYSSSQPIPSTPLFVPASTPISAATTAAATSFTSLLTSAAAPSPVGVLPLAGFGLGLGLDDVGPFGLGRGVWALPDHHVGIGYFGGASGGGDGGGGSRGDTWQLESVESDFSGGSGGGGGGGDCFSSLPELAISTPGNGLK